MPRRKSISQNRSDGFFFTEPWEKKYLYKFGEKKKVAGNGFEPLVYGLWARRDFLTTPPL